MAPCGNCERCRRGRNALSTSGVLMEVLYCGTACRRHTSCLCGPCATHLASVCVCMTRCILPATEATNLFHTHIVLLQAGLRDCFDVVTVNIEREGRVE